ncbi:hypothetical protein QTP88_013639 [Uroleucon formosanum]
MSTSSMFSTMITFGVYGHFSINFYHHQFGNGSIKFIQRQRMRLSYAWRFALTTIILINIYNGNKWAVNNVLNILEPISIVLIASVELKLLGPLISITWRIYFDNKLSNLLKSFMETLDLLKKFNNEVTLKMKIFCICIIGLIMHFMLYITSVIGFAMVPNYPLFDWVVWSWTFIYDRCMFYEYMFLITFVQILVYQLNEEISKGVIPISDLTRMYTSTMESLDVINRSIFGAPVLINIILRNLSSIIYTLYHYVLFKGMFVKVDVHRFFPILDVVMRLLDIIILYYLCQTTENEV